ncbi:PAS domain S-box protein [Leptolyngbya sp. AN02str]|uniref:PAS domain S-box protein n=1 Tax=Leptolyngbya sp. AN02str TaxID=3423363 RepID=UPI003D32168A
MVATVFTAAELCEQAADLCEQAIDRDLLVVSPEMRVGDVINQMSRLRSLPSLPTVGQPEVNPSDFVATRCALIVQDFCVVGIFTTQDIVRLHNQGLLDCDCPIADVMTTPVITLAKSELANPFDALTLLHQHHIRHLPILSHTQAVIGLVTTESMLQLAESLFLFQQQVIQSQTTQLDVHIAQESRDRERIDAALKQSEDKLQALIEALPDLIMRISGNGTYLDFFPSQAFKILQGADRSGRTLWDGCLPVELAEQRMYYIQRALQNKALQIYEQHILIDDKLRTEEVRVVVCGDDEVLLIVRDITERKEVENALIQLNQDLESKIRHRTQSLKESEERFRQIFEQSPLGIAITDLDGNVVRANSRLTATLGYANPSEVLGLSIQDLLCFESSANGVLPLQQLLEQTLSVISFESKPVTKDGKTLWVNVTSALIFSSNFPSSIIHLIEDITDRKQIDNQMRNLSKRLSLAVKAGEVGIWEWNAVTNELVWDERMFQLYGIQLSDFTGTYFDWLQRVHPEDQQDTQGAIEKALQGEREFDTEFRILHSDGTVRFIKAGALLERNQQGQPQRMIGVNFDITNHKQAQAVISQYAREVEDLYNHAPCGYHSVDAQGKIIKINNTALQWLGFRRDEVLGKSVEEFLSEESAQFFRENYPVFKRQGAIQDIELDFICRDRTIFPVLLNATAVRDQDGTYLYSRSTLFDHRKLKVATTSLKRQLVAIEAAIDGIAILAENRYT